MELTADQQQTLDAHLAARGIDACPACGSKTRSLSLVAIPLYTLSEAEAILYQSLVPGSHPLVEEDEEQENRYSPPTKAVRVEIVCQDCGSVRYFDAKRAGVLQ